METVLNDTLLPTIMMRCRSPADGWERYFRGRDFGEDDADNFLRLVPVLRETCRSWRFFVDSRLEYSALRLAQWDLQQLVGAQWNTPEFFVRQQFDLNMEVLVNSWSLQTPMSIPLRTLPLIQLSIMELASLRELLRQGWRVEVQARRGRLYAPANMFWFTPLDRF